MSKNELMITAPEFRITKGTIEGGDWISLKKQAEQVADFVSSIDVTEDTVRGAKKVVAQARKVVNELEDRRKSIKREMLEPYTEFADNLKEITDVINGADATVRVQIRELEGQAREEKRALLEHAFTLRALSYPNLEGVFEFNDFMNQHREVLNKSISEAKCEEIMAKTLHKISAEVSAIFDLDNANAVLAVFTSNGYDMPGAMSVVKQREIANELAEERRKKTQAEEEDRRRRAAELAGKVPEKPAVNQYAVNVFCNTDEFDELVVYMRLKGYSFNYERLENGVEK